MIKSGVITVKPITIDLLIVILILITPLVKYYEVPIVGAGFETLITFVLLFMAGVVLLSRGKEHNATSEMRTSLKWYGLFVAWMVVVTVAYELFTDINVTSAYANYNINAFLMPLLRALILYCLLSGKIKTDRAVDSYGFVINLLVTIYLLQWVLYLCGIRMSFKLPFDYEASWGGALKRKIFGMDQYPTSLFSEKSHFCEYICPYIAMCLYSNDLVRKDRLKKAVFYSACVVSTVSGNGIVIVALLWLMYFVFFGEFKKKRYRGLAMITGVALLVGIYVVLSTIPSFEEMFDILFVDNSGSAFENSKADYRIYRGLDIFLRLPFWAQITGVGYSHMYLFSREYCIVSVFDRSWSLYEYFSAVSMVLLYSGGIGAFFCAKHFYALYKFKSKAVKGLIVITAALWFSTEMLFRTTHIMYILLIIAVLQRESAVRKKRRMHGELFNSI